MDAGGTGSARPVAPPCPPSTVSRLWLAPVWEVGDQAGVGHVPVDHARLTGLTVVGAGALAAGGFQRSASTRIFAVGR